MSRVCRPQEETPEAGKGSCCHTHEHRHRRTAGKLTVRDRPSQIIQEMSEPILAQTLQIVVDAFVRKRVTSACLVASGIVANRMGRGEVVEGY